MPRPFNCQATGRLVSRSRRTCRSFRWPMALLGSGRTRSTTSPLWRIINLWFWPDVVVLAELAFFAAGRRPFRIVGNLGTGETGNRQIATARESVNVTVGYALRIYITPAGCQAPD